jgi:hypothetical protein
LLIVVVVVFVFVILDGIVLGVDLVDFVRNVLATNDAMIAIKQALHNIVSSEPKSTTSVLCVPV